jgi:hypothetical protein
MDFEAIQDSGGRWRIRASAGGTPSMWGIPQPEELLIPEARRVYKKLGDLISQCEKQIRPPVNRFGNH